MTIAVQTARAAWYLNRWNQLHPRRDRDDGDLPSPQYVWTLFTGPLNRKLGTTLAELQWTFLR